MTPAKSSERPLQSASISFMFANESLRGNVSARVRKEETDPALTLLRFSPGDPGGKF